MDIQRSSRARMWKSSVINCCLTLLAFLSVDAGAATRRFEMALFGSSDPNYTDLAWIGPAGPMPAAPRRAILQLDGYYEDGSIAGDLGSNLDWSRIAAVVIDEPYWNASRRANGGAPDWSNPCFSPTDVRYPTIAATEATLASAAATIEAISPATRFWVNYSEPEVRWMMAGCPLNQTYIDVISLDVYQVSFTQNFQSQGQTVSVKFYNDWLVASRAKPQQQLALVPGVFYPVSPVSFSASTAASWLQGYFDYANTLNATGWDAPMVWLVAGWPGVNYDVDVGSGYLWRGIFHPSSAPIAWAWRTQFLNPRLNVMAGWVDQISVSNLVVSGWAVDRTTLISPYVDFWVDGQYWGGTIANQYRSDIASIYGIGNAGFTFNIPAWRNDGRCHNMQVYAVASTAETHNHVLLRSVRICFGSRPPPCSRCP